MAKFFQKPVFLAGGIIVLAMVFFIVQNTQRQKTIPAGAEVEAAITTVTLNNGTTNVTTDTDITAQVNSLGTDQAAYRWQVAGANFMALNMPFNSGATMTDFSGNSNTGTPTNSPTLTTVGCKVGVCMTFAGGSQGSGNDEYVLITDSSSLDLSSSFSVSLWFKVNGNGSQAGKTYDTLIAKNTITWGYLDPFMFYVTRDTGNGVMTVNARVGGGNPNEAAVFGGQNINNGEWHQVVLVVDDPGNLLSLYVDNVLRDTEVQVGTIQTNNANVRIGSYEEYPNYFNGLIDEVQIYNRALSAAQIAQNYSDTNAGAGGPTVIDADETAGFGSVWSLPAVTPISTVGVIGTPVASSNTVTIGSVTLNDGTTNIGNDTDITAQVTGLGTDHAAYRWLASGANLMALNMPFNSGSTESDFSGNANTGTLVNSPTLTTAGCKVGVCMRFDGVDDYINIQHSASLNLSSSFSISLWAKVVGNGANATKDHYSLISKNSTGSGSADPYNITMMKDTFEILARVGSGGSAAYARSNMNFNDNTWHHVALVVDEVNELITYYIDGLFIDDNPTVGEVVTNTTDLRLGVWQGYSNYFNGYLDEVQIYSRALTAAQIASIYADTNAGNGGPTTIDADETVPGLWSLSAVTPITTSGSVGSAVASANTVTVAGSVSLNATKENEDLVATLSPLPASSTFAYQWTVGGSYFNRILMPFNASSTQRDLGGNSYDGSFNSTPTFTTVGCQIGGCLTFDGIDDYVLLPAAAALNIDNDFTISAWIKKTAQSTTDPNGDTTYADDAIYGQSDGLAGSDNPLIMFSVNSNGTIRGWIRGSASDSNYELVTSTQTVDTGVWRHAVMSWAAATDTIKLYLDGSELSVADGGAGTISSNTSTNDWVGIGAMQDDQNANRLHAYLGSIDDVMVFNRTLALAEVQALYADGTNASATDRGGPTTIVAEEHAYNESWQLDVFEIGSSGVVGLETNVGTVVIAQAEDTTLGITTPVGSQDRFITVTYTCQNGVSAARDIQVSFSTNGAAGPFSAATIMTPSSGTVNASVIEGVNCANATSTNTFVWDSLTSGAALNATETDTRLRLVTYNIDSASSDTRETNNFTLANPPLLTSPTAITDGSYDGQHIACSNTTVTIDGTNSFTDMTLINGCVVTQTISNGTTVRRTAITVSGETYVDATSSFNFNEKGFPKGYTSNGASGVVSYALLPGFSPGCCGEIFGGSHGGEGGAASGVNVAAGYGSIAAPNEPGAGSGDDTAATGKNGGGALKLTTGSLVLSGTITANGGSNTNGPGGAGGSVWLVTTGAISGTGTIRANGGTGGHVDNNRGAGSGGRLSFTYNSAVSGNPATPAYTLQAYPGAVSANTLRNGGAGTVYVENTSSHTAGQGNLTIDDNSQNTQRYTEIAASPSTFSTLTIKNNAWATAQTLNVTNFSLENTAVLTHPAATASAVYRLQITASNSFTTAVGAAINANSRGFYRGYTTNGASGTQAITGQTGVIYGGSHGGNGGHATTHPLAFDSITAPVEPGGGGGDDTGAGMSGGGYIKITTAAFTHNGAISANGGTPASSGTGGAGGGIWISVTGAIAGTGTIQTIGGNGVHVDNNHGSGAGGRIAFYFNSAGVNPETLPYTLSASAGTAGAMAAVGGAGTLYTEDSAIHTAGQGDLLVDNNNRQATQSFTPVIGTTGPSSYTFRNVTLTNEGHLSIDTPCSGTVMTVTGSLTVSNNGTMSNSQSSTCTASSPAVAVTTTTLPNVLPNGVYNQTISVTGGVLPRTFSLFAGALPPGFALDPATGVISGTAGSFGIYPFTVRVTDSHPLGAETDDQTYTIAVNQAPSAPTTLFVNDQSAQSGASNPTSIGDTTPAFSAIYNDPDTTDIATKYRIQVATDANLVSMVWDSGASGTAIANCGRGTRCADLHFAGTPLALDAGGYYWRIKFWDQSDLEGPWSEETPVGASFQMSSSGGSSQQRLAQQTPAESPSPVQPDTAVPPQAPVPEAPPVLTVPTAPTIGIPQALSATAIRWYVTDTANNETGFYLLNENGEVLQTVTSANVPFIDELGLKPNAEYRRKIAAFNTQGTSALTAAATLFTYARVPDGLDLAFISSTEAIVRVQNIVDGQRTARADAPGPQAGFDWKARLIGEAVHAQQVLTQDDVDAMIQDYRGQTAYYFENVTTGQNSGWIREFQYTFKDLDPDTFYQIRVRTRNAQGVQTAYTVPKQVRTLTIDFPIVELAMSVQVQPASSALSANFEKIRELGRGIFSTAAFAMATGFGGDASSHLDAQSQELVRQVQQISKLVTVLLLAGLMLLLFKLGAIHRFNSQAFHHGVWCIFRPAAHGFMSMAPQAEDGTYTVSFADFYRHHAHLQAGMLGVLSLIVVKVAVAASVSSMLFAGVTPVSAQVPSAPDDHGQAIQITDQLVYRIDYIHTHGTAATGVVIYNPIHPYFTYLESSGGMFVDNALRFEIGTVNPGQSGSVWYRVALLPDVPQPSLIVNQAAMDANELSGTVVSNTVVNGLGLLLDLTVPPLAPVVTTPVPTEPTAPPELVQPTPPQPRPAVQPQTASPPAPVQSSAPVPEQPEPPVIEEPFNYQVRTPLGLQFVRLSSERKEATALTSASIAENSFTVTFDGEQGEPEVVRGTISEQTDEIVFSGIAIEGSQINVYVDSITVTTIANISGQWQVVVDRALLDQDVPSHEASLQIVSGDIVSEPVPVAEFQDLSADVGAYATDVRTEGDSFTISIQSTAGTGEPGGDNEQPLVVSGKVAIGQDTVILEGTTNEPYTTLTIFLGDSVRIKVVSDAAGQWQTAISRAALGLSERDEVDIRVDVMVAKGLRRSERVNVANLFIPKTAEKTSIETFTRDVAEAAQEVVAKAIETVKVVQQQVVRVVEEKETVIETTLTFAAPVIVASSAPLVGYVPYLPTLLYHALSGLLGAFGRGRGKKRRFYGIVYDSITKEPIALSIVRAYDKATGKLVATQVSDKLGRYDFLLNQGSYRLEVNKPQYQFPSRIITEPMDGAYQNVYREEQGLVMPENDATTTEAVITIPDVPLDPVNKEQQKGMTSFSKRTWLVFQHVGHYLALPVLAIGTVISFVVAITVPENPVNWAMVAFYVVMLGLQFMTRPKKERAWGVVYDQLSNAALPLATVQLIDPTYSKIVKSRLSDYQGRFSFLPDPGKYVIKASKAGYNQVPQPEAAPDRQPLTAEVDIQKPEQRIVGDIAMVPALAPAVAQPVATPVNPDTDV
ncbi:MAG: hypothetical protein HY461_01565 [Parcubacteria group bacterium]|nr:hypothetical protein [Parcubacteria group bacterium]